MRALRLHSDAGIDGLSLDELSIPEPGDGDALVRVRVCRQLDLPDAPRDRAPDAPTETKAWGPRRRHGEVVLARVLVEAAHFVRDARGIELRARVVVE